MLRTGGFWKIDTMNFCTRYSCKCYLSVVFKTAAVKSHNTPVVLHDFQSSFVIISFKSIFFQVFGKINTDMSSVGFSEDRFDPDFPGPAENSSLKAGFH